MPTPRQSRITTTPPKMQRHKGSGQAVVCIDGRDRYLGKYGTDAAKRRYRQLITEWAIGLHDADGHAETIAELVMLCHRHIQRYYRTDGRPSTEVHCQRAALRYALIYADLPVDQFGPLKLQACRHAMIDAGLARSTLNRYIGRIRSMFAWGVAQELVAPSVYHGLLAVKGLAPNRGGRETPPRQPVAWARVAAIEQFLSPQVWAMIQLQWLTGMRPGEACTVRGIDIDTSGTVWLYRPAHHKMAHRQGSRARVIALGPRAQELIKAWLRSDATAHLFQPAEAVAQWREQRRAERIARGGRGNPKPHVRHPRKKPGERYTPDSYRRSIWTACKLAFPPPADIVDDPNAVKVWRKQQRWTPHQLRHSFATRVRKQFSLDAARAALGHTDADVTLDYAELDTQKAITVARRIG